MALGKRVLASNRSVNLLHRGFLACDRYQNGEAAMAMVTCPVLFALGAVDQMTPPKAAQGLIQKAARAEVLMLDGGHHQMTETPDALLRGLLTFLRR